MTSIAKTALALLLLACGFVAAKTFGPPDLAKRLVDSLRPESPAGYGELQPASMNQHQAEFLPPLEMMNPPAGFQAAQSTPAQSTPAPAAQPDWAPVPSTPAGEGGWNARASDPALLPSSFEEEMAPLRPAGRPAAGSAPAKGSAPAVWQSPTTQPLDASWGAAPPTRPAADPPPGWSNGWDAQAEGNSVAPWQPAAPASQPPAQPPAQWPAPAAAPVHEVSQTTAPSLDAPPMDPWRNAAAAAPPVSAWRNEPSTPLAPLTPPSQWAEVDQEPKTHIVADGDSLPRLAERYLGNAARSSEIYELNRQQLTHPELLPLGLELRLPR